MKITRNLLVAAAAAIALTLTACGGDGESDAPAEPTTSSEATVAPTDDATDEPTEVETEASEAPGEDGGSAGESIDGADFAQRYAEAMQDVRQMTLTTEVSGGPADGTSVIQVDLADPDKPISYVKTSTGGMEMEMVSDSANTWMRVAGGEWQVTPADPSASTEYVYDPNAFQAVTLVDEAERRYEVSIDLGIEGSEPLPMTIWLDEHYRSAKTEMDMGEIGVSTTTFDYDTPVSIPEVG